MDRRKLRQMVQRQPWMQKVLLRRFQTSHFVQVVKYLRAKVPEIIYQKQFFYEIEIPIQRLIVPVTLQKVQRTRAYIEQGERKP